MHERFSAENAEKTITMRFGIPNDFVQAREINDFTGGFHIHPATLAAKVAAIDNRKIEKRREVLALLDPALEALDRKHAFPTKVPGEFPESAFVGGAQDSCGKLNNHDAEAKLMLEGHQRQARIARASVQGQMD
jgi:hypothetical protein